MATSIKAILALAGGVALLGGCADYPYYGNGYYGDPYNNGYAYDNGYPYDNGYAYNDYGPGYYDTPGYTYYDNPGWYAGPTIGLGLGFGFNDGDHWEHHERHGGHWRGDHDHH